MSKAIKVGKPKKNRRNVVKKLKLQAQNDTILSKMKNQ